MEPEHSYRVYKSAPFVHIVSQFNPVNTLSPLFVIARTPISKSLNYISITVAAVMGGSLVLVTVECLFIEFSSEETSRPVAICFVLGSICFKSDFLNDFLLFHIGCYLQFFFFSLFHGKWLSVNVCLFSVICLDIPSSLTVNTFIIDTFDPE